MACIDGLDCITEAVGIWGVAVGEAERFDGRYDSGPGVDPGTELRERLPGLLGQLSPDARALVLDHVRHTADLVAFVHRALGRVS